MLSTCSQGLNYLQPYLANIRTAFPSLLQVRPNPKLTSRAKNPLSDAWLTLGEGSNHSQDPPRRFSNFFVDETVNAPEHLARIKA